MPKTSDKNDNTASLTVIKDLAHKILNNSVLFNSLEVINYHIQKGSQELSDNNKVTTKTLTFFESNDLIANQGDGRYSTTSRGKKVNAYIVNQRYE